MDKCSKCSATENLFVNRTYIRKSDGVQVLYYYCGSCVSRLAAQKRQKAPLKFKARNTLNHAVRQGKTPKLPCQQCGEPKAEAHHDDYTKPLDVIWLCRVHHEEKHAVAA